MDVIIKKNKGNKVELSPRKRFLSKELFPLSVIFGLIALYWLQGILYPKGSIISKLSQIITFILCFYYLLKIQLEFKKKEFLYLAITALLFLNLFGVILTGDLSNSLHFGMLQRILGCILPFYPFYYFSKKNFLQEMHMAVFCYILLIVFVFQFFLFNEIQTERQGRAMIINNSAYSLLKLIPFLFLLKKRLIKWGALLIIIVLIIQSAKKGALLLAFISSIIFVVNDFKYIKKNKIFNRGKILILTIGLVILVWRKILSNEFLLFRLNRAIQEGNTSGRGEIFHNIFSYWVDAPSFLNLIFGFGFAESLSITNRHFAHNDWLELLSNFGIFGVFIYLLFFRALIKLYFSFRKREKYKKIVLIIIIVFLGKTVFSMGYTAMETFILMILIGFLLGKKELVYE